MKKYIIMLILIPAIISSCTSDFEGWNTDTKNPSSVPAKTLFSNGQRNMARVMKKQNVNDNVFNFFAQYWTATTYTDEANYDLTGRDVSGGFWNIMYRDVLLDYKEAKIILESQKPNTATSLLPIIDNKIAIVTISEVYTYHVLVDIFGDIPYSEALDIDNPSPKYDDDQEIYADLFTQLDNAISMLNTSEDSFGSADFIYEGNVTNWKKFANSLKLKMALRVKDGSKITEAIASGVFTSNADNASFMFTGSSPYSNPLWENLVESGRKDLVVADTFVDLITPLNDPRASIYMGSNLNPYVGGPYGSNNSYNSYTHLGEIFHKPDFEGIILDYSEVEFLLAEAAARNLGGVSGASTHYENAITASINYWAPSADATAYIAQASVVYNAGNWEMSIGTQKWIALYSRGFEGWSSWRVFGYPLLSAPSGAVDEAENLVPVRYTYPGDEPERNGASYDAASTAMGGDKMTSKVFWNN